MDGKISTFDQLKSFLARAYWLETKMEQAKDWYAFLEVKSDEAKQVLFQLTNDSDNHKVALQKLISNIKDFDLEKTLTDLALQNEPVHYKGKRDGEIFQDIFESEKKAFQLYTTIKDYTDSNLIKSVWLGKRSEDFFETINWLINEEKKHMEIVDPFSMGRIERII
jgi:putative immunity protein/bacteriocin